MRQCGNWERFEFTNVRGNFMGNNLQEKRPFIFKNPKGWYTSYERKSVSEP